MDLYVVAYKNGGPTIGLEGVFKSREKAEDKCNSLGNEYRVFNYSISDIDAKSVYVKHQYNNGDFFEVGGIAVNERELELKLHDIAVPANIID